ATVGLDVPEHLGRLLFEAVGEAGGRRAVLGGDIGREPTRLPAEPEVGRALAEQGDLAVAMLRDSDEAELLQVVAHARTLARGRGELDELETVDAHRVLEGGDLHPEVGALGLGLGSHGGNSVIGAGRAAAALANGTNPWL